MTDAFDSKEFRNVLGNLPTGVVIISGVDASGDPQGITIGSFVSISLDPPLVGFFQGLNSKTWPAIAASGNFCANVLAHDQSELCWRFAKEAESRFDGVQWTPAASGAPKIAGSLAHFDCTIESSSQVGDHLFIVGRVQNLEALAGSKSAMIFFKGAVTGTPQSL
jgi:3-hydroxy-9,10-secoandrosta-1,3,5(10)-triene-9,17-dione monooxygenase reductase component